MKSVLVAFEDLVQKGIIEGYAIGGATALLYYSRPTFTEDIDVFISIRSESNLVDLSPVYRALLSTSSTRIEGEYVYIDGFPVQVLVPYDSLSAEAFDRAVEVHIAGGRCRILSLEYLMAIMIQLHKPKYRERLRILLSERLFDESVLLAILTKHGLRESWKRFRKQLEEES
jgi:hypothetical protein